MLPVLVLLASCSGASKVTNSVISAADPKAALAASSDVMSKESYYLEYRMEVPGEDINGSYIMARDGKNFLIHMEEKTTGAFWMIETGGKTYWCMASGDGLGLGSLFGNDEDTCIDFSSWSDALAPDSSDDPGGEGEGIQDVFDDFLFDPVATVLGGR